MLHCTFSFPNMSYIPKFRFAFCEKAGFLVVVPRQRPNGAVGRDVAQSAGFAKRSYLVVVQRDAVRGRLPEQAAAVRKVVPRFFRAERVDERASPS